METKEKKNISKIVIIGLLIVIIALLIGIGYFLLSDDEVPRISVTNNSRDEYTITLDDFLVNINSTNATNNYLKITLALMYTQEEYGEAINANVSKIRDIIINNLRECSKSELLDDERLVVLKNKIKDNINDSFDFLQVEDIYITDIIVQ